MGNADVCLVSMPYPVIYQPSLALGLLKASLKASGVRPAVLYAGLAFAEEIGMDVYTALGEGKLEELLGEWTFAGAAFPDFHPDHDAYLARVLASPVTRHFFAALLPGRDPYRTVWDVRRRAAPFVDRVAEEVLAMGARVVGCTSTFAQHCASLALLRRVRELAPDVVTLMGGANCEGAMGEATRREFPWVDFVVSGEADLLFPELCRALLDRGRAADPSALPAGVIGPPRRDALALGGGPPRAVVRALDATPVPDYDEYFEALGRSTLHAFIRPGLPVETSRGCWWGAKHHCTFCGLNGSSMGFRSKDPGRVRREFADLSGRYGVRRFNVVDNILDPSYLKTVFPTLAHEGPFSIFYEVKANLRRDQMEVLAAAGVRRVQPGIESMDDSVLKLMDKGNTALMNVEFLKWARELGVFVTWNFLWGIPGEKDEWYAALTGWLPLISHLQPPGVNRIEYHRFSPYHQRPGDFGLSLEPRWTYSAIYPVARESLADLAFFFEDRGEVPVREELARRPGLRAVMRCIGEWSRLWDQFGGDGPTRGGGPPLLAAEDDGEQVVYVDTRPCAPAPRGTIEGLDAQVFRACERATTTEAVARALAERHAPGVTPDDVARAADRLRDRKLLLALDGKLLRLAVRGPVPPIPRDAESFPAGSVDLRAFARAAESVPVPAGC